MSLKTDRYQKYRQSVPVILLILLGSLFLATCSTDEPADLPTRPNRGEEGQPGSKTAPTPVEATLVEQTDLTRTLRLTGRAQPWDDFEVSSQVSGRVAEIFAEQGDWIEKGELLARLDQEALRIELSARQAELERNQVDLEFAQRNWKRGEQLLAKGAISQSEVDNLEQAVRVAETRVRSAEIGIDAVREQLQQTEVHAPAGGKIADRQVSSGEHIRETQLLFKIIQLHPLKIVTEIPEASLGRIRPGQSAELAFEALSDTVHQGRVHFIDPMANPRSGAFPVEIRLSNSNLQIQPGMVARVELSAGTLSDALSIHSDTLLENELGSYVFVIQNGVARRRSVEVLERIEDRVVVRGDLGAGDRLVTAGKMNVTDGTRLEVLP